MAGRLPFYTRLLQKNISILLFAGICAVALTLSVLLNAAFPPSCQTFALSSRKNLTEEIRLLANSDVKANISRRTDFVIKLYTNNSEQLTPPKIREIYDEEYTKQAKAKNNLVAAITFFLGTAIVAVIVSIKYLKKSDPAKFKKVSLTLPFGLGSAEWETDPTERRAAWSLYVELNTRIAVQQLQADQGLLREALNSLYSLFPSTRQILREAGPILGASRESVGGIAIRVLNEGLRPFLSKWHPALGKWEAQRPTNISAKQREEDWPDKFEFRNELELLRQNLEVYADNLAKIAGVQKRR